MIRIKKYDDRESVNDRVDSHMNDKSIPNGPLKKFTYKLNIANGL